GHFQAADDPAIEARFSELPRVRRLSGGGAILHDQGWTYSVAVGSSHNRAGHASQPYRVIHEAVIGVPRSCELPARLRGEADQSLDHHFLCFSRGDANDVVIERHKVLGSAQRRRRGAVLQHGALLLRASSYAPEFPGILDLASAPVDEGRLFDALARATSDATGPDSQIGELDHREPRRAREL